MIDYALPDPKENPNAALVLVYKVLKGVDYADKSWDKIHFGDCSKSAKQLIEVCGDFTAAERCLHDLANKYGDDDYPWTFRTVVRNSHDWIVKKKGKSYGSRDGDYQRLRHAILEQRNARKNVEMGKLASAREIIDSAGSVPGFQSQPKKADAGPD